MAFEQDYQDRVAPSAPLAPSSTTAVIDNPHGPHGYYEKDSVVQQEGYVKY